MLSHETASGRGIGRVAIGAEAIAGGPDGRIYVTGTSMRPRMTTYKEDGTDQRVVLEL